MFSVDEYRAMAKESAEKGEHVAVMTYYRNAIEGIGLSELAAPILLESVLYAQRMNKTGDRRAVAEWVQNVSNSISSFNLEQKVNLENGKLRTEVI